MAVNRELLLGDHAGRPHTSGMPFLNGGIIYRQQYEVKDNIPGQAQLASLRTRGLLDEGAKSGRQGTKSSKSHHPNQSKRIKFKNGSLERKKNQTSRSTPKGYTSIVNTNIQAQIVNTTA
jgi:hypothetical protein